MSWATCYNSSNNIHFDFPPLMSDGRNYADWQPGATINENIRKSAGITSNWQYRKYLTNNAENIMRYNNLSTSEDCNGGSSDYSIGQNDVPNTPYTYKNSFDKSQPYGYEGSDLKNAYLDKFQLQSRMVTPVFTQEQLLKNKYPKSK
jgi:hypothetical protein